MKLYFILLLFFFLSCQKLELKENSNHVSEHDVFPYEVLPLEGEGEEQQPSEPSSFSSVPRFNSEQPSVSPQEEVSEVVVLPAQPVYSERVLDEKEPPSRDVSSSEVPAVPISVSVIDNLEESSTVLEESKITLEESSTTLEEPKKPSPTPQEPDHVKNVTLSDSLVEEKKEPLEEPKVILEETKKSSPTPQEPDHVKNVTLSESKNDSKKNDEEDIYFDFNNRSSHEKIFKDVSELEQSFSDKVDFKNVGKLTLPDAKNDLDETKKKKRKKKKEKEVVVEKKDETKEEEVVVETKEEVVEDEIKEEEVVVKPKEEVVVLETKEVVVKPKEKVAVLETKEVVVQTKEEEAVVETKKEEVVVETKEEVVEDEIKEEVLVADEEEDIRNQLFKTASVDLILEEFFQKNIKGNKKVDILLVLDHTESLKVDYPSMAKRFKNLLESQYNLDWKLGMITGHKLGQLLPFNNGRFFIDSKTKSYQKLIQKTFSNLSDIKENLCLNCPPNLLNTLEVFLSDNNNSFLRQDSVLSVVFITDRDIKTLNDHRVFDTLESFDYSISHIGVPVGDDECLDVKSLFGNPHYSYNLTKLVEQTRGFIGDICHPGFIQSLLPHYFQLQTYFRLKKTPIKSSVSVTVAPPPKEDLRWVFQDGGIIFDKPPLEGSVIEIIYESSD